MAESEEYIRAVIGIITQRLEEAGVKAEVTGRPKNIYSIHRKMQEEGLHFDQVYDLVAFRIIVATLRECYEALGVAHASWKPIPGRFKDYIALPKVNMYQSLHTTVIGPQGQRMEVQIRTARDAQGRRGRNRRALELQGRRRPASCARPSASPGCAGSSSGSRTSRTRRSSSPPSRMTSFPKRSSFSRPRATCSIFRRARRLSISPTASTPRSASI